MFEETIIKDIFIHEYIFFASIKMALNRGGMEHSVFKDDMKLGVGYLSLVAE